MSLKVFDNALMLCDARAVDWHIKKTDWIASQETLDERAELLFFGISDPILYLDTLALRPYTPKGILTLRNFAPMIFAERIFTV